jgi:hypothetical protein
MESPFTVTFAPLVQRGRTRLTPNEWIAWRPDPTRPPVPLAAEWIWRGLRDLDLRDPAQVLTVLDRHGMIWGRYEDLRDDAETPAERGYPTRPPIDDTAATIHLMDAGMYLETLRRIAEQWAYSAEHGQELPADFWYALGLGMRPFTLLLDVKAAVIPATSPLVVDLYEAGCWQLARTILKRPQVRRCHNETCGRVFFQRLPASDRAWSPSARVLYCSDDCADAQRQRAYRRRQQDTRHSP